MLPRLCEEFTMQALKFNARLATGEQAWQVEIVIDVRSGSQPRHARARE